MFFTKIHALQSVICWSHDLIISLKKGIYVSAIVTKKDDHNDGVFQSLQLLATL